MNHANLPQVESAGSVGKTCTVAADFGQTKAAAVVPWFTGVRPLSGQAPLSLGPQINI